MILNDKSFMNIMLTIVQLL